MKLFRQLLVAPAALGLMAPMAANAAELNINQVSDYSGSQVVKSVSQFSDVYPTDWAYQALIKMADRHSCKVGNTSSALTRYEAAAILNTCLANVSQVNEEEKRLMNEFSSELAVIKGRLEGVEADVGVFSDSSTTTTISGETIFVAGAVEGLDEKEAFHLNYRTTLQLDTNFPDGGELVTQIRVGNFGSTPFADETLLESSYSSSDELKINKAYYKWPVSDSLTATVGALVRQDDMLEVWPSSYPSDSVLDVLTYAGANAAYSLAEGAGASLNYTSGNWNVGVVYVGDEGTDSTQGIMTEESSDDVTAQVAWVGDGFTVAAAYTYSDGGNTGGTANSQDFDAWGLSAQWNPDLDSSLLPSSINGGFGFKNLDKENDASNIEDEQTWSIGLLWDDFAVEGNTLGIGIGSAEGWRDDSKYDDPIAFEVFYSMAVTDNITITPALFQVERNDKDDITGGLVKTTFNF